MSSGSKVSFSLPIQRIATLTLALSLATMLVTVSLVAGFKETISDKLYHLWGSHRVVSTSMANETIGEYWGLTPRPELEKSLRDAHIPFDRFSSIFTILHLPNGVEGMMLKSFEQMERWDDFLVGKRLPLDTSGYEVYLSTKTAKKYQLHLGDPIWIHFFTQGETGASRMRKMKVAGFFHTGIAEYDEKIMHCHARVLQKMGYTGIGGYELFAHRLDERKRSEMEAGFLNLPWEWTGLGIEKIMPDLFDWMYYVESTEGLFIVVLSVLILVNLMIGFMLFVVDRSKMIGVLMALGYPKRTIFLFILSCGMRSNFWGIWIGLVVASLFLYGQSAFHWIKLNEEVHYLAFAQIKIEYGVWLAVVGWMSLVGLVSLLFPARVAMRFNVNKVLRFS